MSGGLEPFAMMLHRRYRDGETVQQLAARLEIPEDRVVQRIRAAALYATRQETAGGLGALHAELNRRGPGQSSCGK